MRLSDAVHDEALCCVFETQTVFALRSTLLTFEAPLLLIRAKAQRTTEETPRPSRQSKPYSGDLEISTSRHISYQVMAPSFKLRLLETLEAVMQVQRSQRSTFTKHTSHLRIPVCASPIFHFSSEKVTE